LSIKPIQIEQEISILNRKNELEGLQLATEIEKQLNDDIDLEVEKHLEDNQGSIVLEQRYTDDPCKLYSGFWVMDNYFDFSDVSEESKVVYENCILFCCCSDIHRSHWSNNIDIASYRDNYFCTHWSELFSLPHCLIVRQRRKSISTESLWLPITPTTLVVAKLVDTSAIL
jgi:hypothetical protein